MITTSKTLIMKYDLPSILFLFLFLAFGACTISQRNRQFAEGVPDLQGSYWMLVSLQGQDLKDIPETNTAYIRFEEGSDELRGYAGCNRLQGRYQANDSTLHLTNLSTTRMMCPYMEQENSMMAILEKVNSYVIAGEVLTLFHDKKAVATFKAGGDPALDNDEEQR